MITTLDDAQHEVWAMRMDAEADYCGDEEVEIDPRDLVVSCCFNIENDKIARELCRVELGFIPFELEGRLGKTDWVQ